MPNIPTTFVLVFTLVFLLIANDETKPQTSYVTGWPSAGAPCYAFWSINFFNCFIFNHGRFR